MTVNTKTKQNNNKIVENKVQYDLNRQNAKILALSSRNGGKYNFLRDEVVLLGQ